MAAHVAGTKPLVPSLGLDVAWAHVRNFTKDFAGRLAKDRTLGLGAEMAFWLFLSLLPLAAVAGLIVAKVTVAQGTLNAPLLDSLPHATRELIAKELGEMAAWNGGQFGAGAAVMFVWLASSGVASIFEGIEQQTQTKPRSWFRTRALAMATCVALSLGVALITLLQTGLGWIWQLSGHPKGAISGTVESPLATLFRFAMSFGISFGLVSGLYYIAIPKRHRKAMPIAPGAALAIALQTLVGFGYALYIRGVGDSGAYQAGLASIGVTMIGLYLLCLALLVGAELNQLLGDRRCARKRVAASI